MKENNESNIFNLGTEQGDSVKQVFDTCEKVLNKKIAVDVVERREGDPAKLYANANKAKSMLNWHPKRTLENSIETAYNWELRLKEIKEGK